MVKFFQTMDKIRPVYDWVYRIFLFICKILLIADILITSYDFNRFTYEVFTKNKWFQLTKS